MTADDFGLARAINEAVEIAYRDGILTCASLMVAGSAVADALERARRLSGLKVGLHIVVVEGRPKLPPEMIPDLVDSGGNFDANLVRAGVRFFFLPRVRRQLRAEIRAQFEAFRDSGLSLDHVNCHKHMHLHPTVLSCIIRIGREHGLRAVRLPREPVRSALSVSRRDLFMRLWWAIFLAPWMWLLRRRLRRAGLRYNEVVFGLGSTGAMTEETMLRIVRCLPADVSEIYLHPAVSDDSEGPLPMPACRHEAELRALTSPRVRSALSERGARLAGFGDLA